MGLVVDSSSLVAAERGQLDVAALMAEASDEPVVISAVTASELLQGAKRLRGVQHARAEIFVNALLDHLPVIAFDLEIARVHAGLSADLRGRGQAIGPHDLIIAATAVFLDYDVATRDLRSFPKIKGLRVRRW